MAQPLARGTFRELLGRQLPTTLGQRVRNEPKLFPAAGIYFEYFVRLQNHTNFGVHSNVKQTPKWDQMLTMLATEVTGTAPALFFTLTLLCTSATHSP